MLQVRVAERRDWKRKIGNVTLSGVDLPDHKDGSEIAYQIEGQDWWSDPIWRGERNELGTIFRALVLYLDAGKDVEEIVNVYWTGNGVTIEC